MVQESILPWNSKCFERQKKRSMRIMARQTAADNITVPATNPGTATVQLEYNDPLGTPINLECPNISQAVADEIGSQINMSDQGCTTTGTGTNLVVVTCNDGLDDSQGVADGFNNWCSGVNSQAASSGTVPARA
jgi:hypothetical protein